MKNEQVIEARHRKKRLLFVTVLSQTALVTAGVNRLVTGSSPELQTLIAIFILLYCVPLYLTFKNHLKVASNLFLFVTAGLVTVLMWQNEGVRDEALMVFPALLVFAILLGSNRVFWLIYILTTINVLVVGYLNDIGAVYHPVQPGDLGSAITTSIIFAVIALTMKLVGNDMKQAFKELEIYKSQLEEKVELRTQELSESQNKLHESEKMAALGRLVAGLAHEINTPIGVAMTASSHLSEQNAQVKGKIDAGSLTKTQMDNYLTQLDESARLVNANLYRAVELISDFKKVSVITSDERKLEFNVSEVIENTIATLQPVLKENKVTIKTKLEKKTKLFKDPANLVQTFNNLILNSIHHGFEQHDQNDRQINIRSKKRNNQLHIEYQDNGCGIPEDVMHHIFEPFYTTKRNKGGTGLGMHIVYNMVTQGLDGEIRIEKPDVGAKFELIIPVGELQ